MGGMIRSVTCRRRIGILAAILGMLPAVDAVLAAPGAVTTQPFAGVVYTHRTQALPRPLSIHIVEIDLANPDIRFMVTPKNGAGSNESVLRTTQQFVDGIDAQIGINASFFGYDGANLVNRGLVASDGDVYSPFGEFNDTTRPWPVLNLSADNIARIVNRDSNFGTQTDPSIPLYNAVSGSERIVTNGVNTAGNVTYGEPAVLHPRTVAGITADQKLILMVVDGRQDGFSQGFTSSESANLLISYGVTDAINLDGGGSTTMVMARPDVQVINRPSNTNNASRAVTTSLAVFAGESTTSHDVAVFADFYGGDRGTFSLAPTFSGSTAGVLGTSTNQAVQNDQAVAHGWFQRLTINDDPQSAGTGENPDGWFVRHVSGSSAAPSQNIARPTTGYVGFWARTETEGVQAAIAIDNPDTAERGLRKTLIADGKWHLYEWNLEDDSQWEGWISGTGSISGETFTLDSIQFFGPNSDAMIDLDMISHNAHGSLIPEPSGMAVLLPIGALGFRRRRRQCA